jgi:hypothetical protein
MTSPTEIAALQAQIEERDRRIALLERELEKHRPPPPPVATRLGPFVLPNRDQYVRLLAIVSQKFPAIADIDIRDDKLADFIKAFTYVSTLYRTLELDPRTDKSMWADRSGTKVPSFMLATIAAGDIVYADTARFPFDLGWGLTVWQRADARPATNAWLTTLDGIIKPAVKLTRPRQSEVRELMPGMVTRNGEPVQW